jgi:hypothetical protein
MNCTNWSCPLHACMSPECQLAQVVLNNPFIVAGTEITGDCPRRKEFEEARALVLQFLRYHGEPVGFP